MATDVVVVGAGIFGVTAALEMRRRGHTVTLLDPGPLPHPDAASTDISKVVRADYGADRFYAELMLEALERWRLLNDHWDEPLFHETGFSILSSVPMAAGSFEHDSYATMRGLGVDLERLDASAIHRRFAVWREGRYLDGYYNPRGGWAESGKVVSALIAEAQRLGVVLTEGKRVASIERDPLALLTDEGDRYQPGQIIVAAGAWTPQLIGELDDRLVAVGQPVMHFAPTDAAPFRAPRFVPWAADIGRTGWYGFCANAADIVKIANHGVGRRVDPGQPRALAHDAEGRFRTFLRDSLPDLAAAPVVGTRLCLYCDSFDGDLFIARHPEASGLVIAAGGSGHGFKFAPVLGDIIADVAEGKPNRWAHRFAWREHAEPRFEGARQARD
jgi:glycine/D-amino acid oxidase-like deaminating enzyme